MLMAVQFKTISQPINRIKILLQEKIGSVPVVKRTAQKIASSSAFKAVLREAKRGSKQVAGLLEELPRDKKSVRPFLSIQRKRFEKLSGDLKMKVTAQSAQVKAKRKSARAKSRVETA